MHTISLTNDDNRPEIATANGQFLLIRRDVYESVGGHEAVKDRIVEDVELVRLLKSQDRSIRFFSGANFLAHPHARLAETDVSRVGTNLFRHQPPADVTHRRRDGLPDRKLPFRVCCAGLGSPSPGRLAMADRIEVCISGR